MGSRVLICDDELVMRVLIRAALADGGYEIHEARDGVESIDRIRATKPDLVVLDHRMPGRTGLEVLTEVRNDLELCATHIVLLTAMTERLRGEGAFGAADACLTKPFSPQELSRIVVTLLGGGA